MSSSNSNFPYPKNPLSQPEAEAPVREPVFWRVEGSLLNLTAVRPVGFFAWNAQTFAQRWVRRGSMAVLAVARPLLYVTNRSFATRLLHTVLRGVSRDRLDLLGEEFFEYFLKSRLKAAGEAKLRETIAAGNNVVLVSQGLDHVMRPLAKYLGAAGIISNRLDFRDGISTGRLLDPVIRPRGLFARFTGGGPDGRLTREKLVKALGFEKQPQVIEEAICSVARPSVRLDSPTVQFRSGVEGSSLSVRDALRGKSVLLIGGTGFIGKVWLANLLRELPEIGRVYLLVRHNKTATSLQRFQRVIEESPVFDWLVERHGAQFVEFLREKTEVVDGDVSKQGLGMDPEVRKRLAATVDLIINSSGLTDFNPDVRDALAMNVRATNNLLEFLKQCAHGSLLHLSTSYVVGRRDGRVLEELPRNYTPKNVPGYDAVTEWQSLEALVRNAEARAESAEVTNELTRAAQKKEHAAKDLHGASLENQIRKNRTRWLRQTLTDAGSKRAQELGWPNTYTYTKSLSESLIRNFLDANPSAAIAVVRPSIVESTVAEPFPSWNEGVNTSAALSYLLGTFFRQLPSTETKCLDLIPVDSVTRGMTLIAAALVTRRNARVYHLATSVINPCDMARSIELTSLAHRKYYRAQKGFEYKVLLKLDAISVSKERYEAFSAPAQQTIVKLINRTAEPFASRPPLARAERELEKVIKLIALFEPFILHNDHVFEAANVENLNVLLPESERAAFGYDTRSIDWWDYWINVHVPALRKWCYPLIEGRPMPEREKRSVQLAAPPDSNVAQVAGASTAISS
jgi:nucleoside-diphosphate-sugar epimerase